MDALIERLKAATQGCAELDMAIAVAVGRERETHVIRYQDGVSQRVPWRADRAGGTIPTPCYSRSLDAAVTLIPNAHLAAWEVSWADGYSVNSCESRVSLNGGDKLYIAIAPTPALALCIAALMAREAAP